jgi:hypothetical protein
LHPIFILKVVTRQRFLNPQMANNFFLGFP